MIVLATNLLSQAENLFLDQQQFKESQASNNQTLRVLVQETRRIEDANHTPIKLEKISFEREDVEISR